jgi:phosphonate transport system ATP-binding protein
MSAIEVKELSKTFNKHKALNDVSLEIQSGEMVALIGASGSGKSTLIRHLAGLIYGDKGCCEVSIMGQTVQKNGKQGRKIRKIRSQVGVVFQQFNLVMRLSVLTNVLTGFLGQVPAWRGSLGVFTQEEKQRAMEALQRVGIERLATQRSSTLSGGQQQRAAIARTIAQGAEVILADEPIASLDPASSRKVMDTLKRVNEEDGVTVLVSLHQVDYALQYCPRTIAMRDGQVVFDGASSKLTPDFLKELYGDNTLELYGETKQDEPVEEFVPNQGLALAPA